jgi:membrane protein
VLISTGRTYVDDNCGTYAAAIAYYAIFSVVPLSLVVLSIFGLVVDQVRIEQFVFEQIPLKETEAVRSNVQEIVRRARDVSVAGLGAGVLILLWSSSGIFSAVRRGLNATSHRRRRRPYWHGKLLDLALVPAVGVLILISLGLTAMLQVAVERAGNIGPADLTANLAFQAGSVVLAALFSFTMFALLYRYVPSARPGWREALFGAGLATVLFELTKYLYAAFFALTPFQRDTAVYAGFGTAMAFLLWMFVNASILLLGAEFGRAVTAEAGPGAALPLVGETP